MTSAPRARATSASRSARRHPPWPTVVSTRSVVFHVEPLTDDVGRDGFETRERLETALEDDDLLVAVHPLDAEYRFGVQLAGGAGRRQPVRPLSARPAGRPPARDGAPA